MPTNWKRAKAAAKAGDGQDEAPSPASVRFVAMSLLAQREHSRLELRQKLLGRFDDEALIDTIIQNLADEALQSDDRFAEAFVAMRKRKGQGPIRIVNELRLRGVDDSVYAPYLDADEEEWCELAHSVCLRKYGDLATAAKERARQMRFLQYRGFSSEQIRRIWKDIS